jgi:hypothetical protein
MVRVDPLGRPISTLPPPEPPIGLPLSPSSDPVSNRPPTPPDFDVLYVKAYHIQTRLADARPSLIADAGSVGNLCGEKWTKEVAIAAARRGQHPVCERRPRPLRVSGAGAGHQSCESGCKLPVASRRAAGRTISIGDVTTPAGLGSDLPGLLGLSAIRKNRAILDFNTLKFYFCGPGD